MKKLLLLILSMLFIGGVVYAHEYVHEDNPNEPGAMGRDYEKEGSHEYKDQDHTFYDNPSFYNQKLIHNPHDPDYIKNSNPPYKLNSPNDTRWKLQQQ